MYHIVRYHNCNFIAKWTSKVCTVFKLYQIWCHKYVIIPVWIKIEVWNFPYQPLCETPFPVKCMVCHCAICETPSLVKSMVHHHAICETPFLVKSMVHHYAVSETPLFGKINGTSLPAHFYWSAGNVCAINRLLCTIRLADDASTVLFLLAWKGAHNSFTS